MSLTETIPAPPSLPRSSATFSTGPSVERTPSKSNSSAAPSPVKSSLRNPRSQKSLSSISTKDTSDEAWGANFWVTIVDPQANSDVFLRMPCDGTGELGSSYRKLCPPPPAPMANGETVWERPSGFVIPLGIIQNTALGRRLSQVNRFSKGPDDLPGPSNAQAPTYRRSKSYTGPLQTLQDGSEGRRSSSTDHSYGIPRLQPLTSNLPTIPGSSPDVTDLASSPSSRKTFSLDSF
ncbi:Rho GTPase-activating protein 39 [Mycena venus]|uniref:Rho GTPase-activating protein 39 n=1 Tax=Mycena venus TaxID=2733690 RepID=A0A8H6YPF6_9AGAR|nr:Rho GTPase-activating protein 39 [Mycena venus]